MGRSGLPDVGDVVLYVTGLPNPAGGVVLARVAAIVTALGEDGSVDITAFPPGEDPRCVSRVSRSEGLRPGGWEPRACDVPEV